MPNVKGKISDFQRHLRKVPPRVLWHYTSLEGLRGIVAEQSIWATDIRYLNDSSEFLHALGLFRELILERKKVSNEATRLVLEKVQRLLDDVHGLDKNQVFVTSFSASEDQLSQWRAYGPTAKGISLGLDLRNLDVIDPAVSSSVFAPCIYSLSRQRALINGCIDGFCDLHERLQKAMAGVKDKDLTLNMYDSTEVFSNKMFALFGPKLTMELLGSILDIGRLCALIKHEAFSEEKEWRLVVVESRSRVSPSPHKRLTRVGSTTLIPYISVPLRVSGGKSGAHGRIRSIKVGPHPDSGRAINAIRDFLSAEKISGVDVDASRIPFRTS